MTTRTAGITFYVDIDGVLSTPASQRRAGKGALDRGAVARVADLVDEFDGEVVVSSTWRIDDCRDALVAAGLRPETFAGDWRTAVTSASMGPDGGMLAAELAGRGDEIEEHRLRNGVERWIVLDDVDVGRLHEGRHVRPDPEVGLTRADADLARVLAGRQVRSRAG